MKHLICFLSVTSSYCTTSIICLSIIYWSTHLSINLSSICLSFNLSIIYWSTNLPIYPSIHPSINQPINQYLLLVNHLFTYESSIYLIIHLSINPSVYQSICLILIDPCVSIHLSTNLSIHPSIYLVLLPSHSKQSVFPPVAPPSGSAISGWVVKGLSAFYIPSWWTLMAEAVMSVVTLK